MAIEVGTPTVETTSEAAGPRALRGSSLVGLHLPASNDLQCVMGQGTGPKAEGRVENIGGQQPPAAPCLCCTGQPLEQRAASAFPACSPPGPHPASQSHRVSTQQHPCLDAWLVGSFPDSSHASLVLANPRLVAPVFVACCLRPQRMKGRRNHVAPQDLRFPISDGGKSE